MGSLVCCCRNRSNGDAAESEATDGSTGEGEQEGVAVSDLALRVGNTGLDALIALGEVVPVVGDFFGLIEVFKDRCGDLSARIDEAKELGSGSSACQLVKGYACMSLQGGEIHCFHPRK